MILWWKIWTARPGDYRDKVQEELLKSSRRGRDAKKF